MEAQSLKTFITSHFPPAAPKVDEMTAHFELRYLKKGEHFLQAGKVSNDYLFLESGFMRAYTINTNGEEVTTAFYSPNRMVFEASSFFMRSVSSENIQALSDCKGFVISFEKLNHLFHSVAEFREFGRMILVKEFALFKQRTLSMINQTAEERYNALIQNNRELFQHASLKQIASYLGITDSSLSRIRREVIK
ncbi:MAG: Crp/Fnr family transcriptional regulator [Bacteroidia bacterium]|nr:Crp/Fnr family transcriptional regulator [Bacteroidia bacterium]